MPAVSESQQRLFGMVHAYQKGKLKNPPKKVKEVAKHISEEDAEHFARTKHKGLPEKKAFLTTQARRNTMNKAYERGFMGKCAEYGVDRRTALAIMKKAGLVDKRTVNTVSKIRDWLARGKGEVPALKSKITGDIATPGGLIGALRPRDVAQDWVRKYRKPIMDIIEENFGPMSKMDKRHMYDMIRNVNIDSMRVYPVRNQSKILLRRPTLPTPQSREATSVMGILHGVPESNQVFDMWTSKRPNPFYAKK